jgi:hypothetical protein
LHRYCQRSGLIKACNAYTVQSQYPYLGQHSYLTNGYFAQLSARLGFSSEKKKTGEEEEREVEGKVSVHACMVNNNRQVDSMLRRASSTASLLGCWKEASTEGSAVGSIQTDGQRSFGPTKTDGGRACTRCQQELRRN